MNQWAWDDIASVMNARWHIEPTGQAVAVVGASIDTISLEPGQVFFAFEGEQVDAGELPFTDGSFDVVTCQFGVMFFPDKARSYAEVRRVLRPGGAYVFNTWDSWAENPFVRLTHEVDNLLPGLGRAIRVLVPRSVIHGR